MNRCVVTYMYGVNLERPLTLDRHNIKLDENIFTCLVIDGLNSILKGEYPRFEVKHAIIENQI